MANESCRHGQTDSGKNAVGTIMELAALAVAGINTAAAITMANQQYEIAKDYLDIAEWWRDWYNTVYKPWEDKELEEIWNLEEETPEYDITIGRTRTYARMEFKGMDYQGIRCTSEYCTGLRGALLKDAFVAEATATAALSNLGWQNEKAWVEARNDLRWKKILSVANRGRDMIADNVQFTQLAFGIFGDLGKQAGASIGGAIGYLGYSRNRNETKYPGLASQTVIQRRAAQPQQPQQPQRPAPVIRSGVVFDPGSTVGRAASDEELAR